jgi:hypothetical protein
MRRLIPPTVLLAAVFLLLTALAPTADAAVRQRLDPRTVDDLARRLDDAAYDAHRLSTRRSYGYDDRYLDAAFARLLDAAESFHRATGSRRFDTNASRRSFDNLAARYYELRGEMRYYHGPRDVRVAFHRFYEPMERLYRIYTGRDLYRDDPNLRIAGQRGARGHQGSWDGDDDRHGDARRGDDRGAGRTRVPRRYQE